MVRRADIIAKLPNAYVSYAILALGNILLNVLLPANSGTMQAYHLSVPEYRTLIFLIDLPMAAIWFTAIYGYNALRDYAQLIKKTDDGRVFSRIATGLAWLAWGLPISSILTVILYAIVHNNIGFYTAALIINHYVGLIVFLVAFSYIGSGTHRLARRHTQVSVNHTRAILGIFTLVGVMYTYYTINQISGSAVNPYHLPMWLILLTLIVPYLYAWFMGLLAAGDVLLHRQKAKGLFYKRGLTYLASGIAVVIASSIMISLLTSSSRYLIRLNLNAVLAIVYVFLSFYAIGFILVALGAKRLKKLEEV